MREKESRSESLLHLREYRGLFDSVANWQKENETRAQSRRPRTNEGIGRSISTVRARITHFFSNSIFPFYYLGNVQNIEDEELSHPFWLVGS